LIDILDELWREIPAGRTKIAYGDFGLYSLHPAQQELTDALYTQKEYAERELTKRIDFGQPNTDIRLGVVDSTLYFWTHDNNPNDLINAFGQERFYFGDRPDFLDLTRQIRDEVGIDHSGRASLRALNDLMSQMTTAHVNILHTSPYGPSMTGEQMKFILDGLGMRLPDLEGRISAVAGLNGQGRINNPRFPEGIELGILRARLEATINSDCHIRQDGCTTYYEDKPDRIDRVEQYLRAFGDVTLHRSTRGEGGHYEITLPRVIGRAFVHWGCTVGDKPVQNRGVTDAMKNGTLPEVRAYFEDLIPQDGCFTLHGGFSWARSVTLDAGTKNEVYGFKPKIQEDEIDFVKEHAVAHWDERHLVCLPTPELRRLENSDDPETSSTAALLRTAIERNPSKLLNDEVDLVMHLGIKTTPHVKDIVYSKTTGRVSVCWTAAICGDNGIARFALLCPPNDLENNAKVNEWLSQHPHKVRQAREQIMKEGFSL
jgi:hypothetical protein